MLRVKKHSYALSSRLKSRIREKIKTKKQKGKIIVLSFLTHNRQIVIITWYIKVGLSPFKKNHFIWFNQSPLKIMKNAFYSFSRYQIFVLTFRSCRKNGLIITRMLELSSPIFLIRKIRLISQVIMSQRG